MVLLVSYSGVFGGGERLLLDFAPGLEDATALVCPEGPLAREARGQGITVFPIPERSLLLRGGGPGRRARAAAGLAAHAREIRRLVAELDPQLLIAWSMRSAIASLLAAPLGCPVVFQHNDLLPDGLVGRLVRAAARRARRTIVLSHAIARDLDPHGRLGERLIVVHPGIDCARFRLDVQPADPPEVLVLGALVGWKRPDLALEAFRLAKQSDDRLRLRLVGAALEEDSRRFAADLKARARELGLEREVEFAGAVEDSRDALARATCLLHCAEHEPFGMAVLETLAAGRPAVVPNAAGPAEIVDRSCGVLYEPGSAAAAAAGLLEVVRDREHAQRLGAAGRLRAQTHFDLDRARERYAHAVRPGLEEVR